MVAWSGGEKFQAMLNEIAAKIDKPGTLKVGFLAGSTAPNGDSLPLRAALNEFGHEHNGVVTRPRPFFRTMIAAKYKEWPDAIANLLRMTNYDVERTLALAGEGIKGQLVQSILDLWDPPLSPVTIAKKGFDKPLIDHGDMINAVAAEVNGSVQASTTNAAGYASAAKTATKSKP
jgi:hypothetical protein